MPSELSDTSPLDLSEQWRVHQDALQDPDLAEAINRAKSYWDGVLGLVETSQDLQAAVKFLDEEYGAPWFRSKALVCGTVQEVALDEKGCQGVPVEGSKPKKLNSDSLTFLGFISVVSDKTGRTELCMLGFSSQSETAGKYYAITLDSSVAFMSGGSEVHKKAVLEKYVPNIKSQIDQKLQNQIEASGKSLLSLKGLDLSELEHFHPRGDVFIKVCGDMCSYLTSKSGLDAGVEHVMDYTGSLIDPDTGISDRLDEEQIIFTPHGIVHVSVPNIDNSKAPNSLVGILGTMRSTEFGSDLQMIILVDGIKEVVTMREFLSSDMGQAALRAYIEKGSE